MPLAQGPRVSLVSVFEPGERKASCKRKGPAPGRLWAGFVGWSKSSHWRGTGRSPPTPRQSKIYRTAASLGCANNCLHCFPWGPSCHDFPNTQPFQTREPDTLGDPGLNITWTSCLNDYFFTSIWIPCLWSMTTVDSHVLEAIRRQLIFHKQ